MSFQKLNENFFVISNIYAERQEDDDNAYFEMKEPRRTDAFLLFTEKTAICGQEGKRTLYVPHGALVYIPRGCKYTWENHSITENSRVKSMLFNFTIKLVDLKKGDLNELIINKLEDKYQSFDINEVTIVDYKPIQYERLFSKLIDTFNDKSSSFLEIYLAAYDIFKLFLKNYSYKDKKDLSIIEYAMHELSEIKKDEKNIKDIADECFVSVSTLEKQFIKYLGVSPLKYRLECKIEYVKKCLYNGNMNLEEMVDVLNFCDASYLCRIFKKYTGVTPKQYILQLKKG